MFRSISEKAFAEYGETLEEQKQFGSTIREL